MNKLARARNEGRGSREHEPQPRVRPQKRAESSDCRAPYRDGFRLAAVHPCKRYRTGSGGSRCCGKPREGRSLPEFHGVDFFAVRPQSYGRSSL
jgi:hypothetical protein